MYKITLEIFDWKIRFETNAQVALKDQGVFKHFNIIDNTNPFDFTVRYLDDEKEEITFNYKDEIIFMAPWSKVQHGESLKTLIMASAQWVLQNNGVFMLHASCVAKDNKALLLFGTSGAGKTSLAIKLCRKYGFSFISNGSTLIKVVNNNVIVLGTVKKGIKLRYSSYSRMDIDHANILFAVDRNKKSNDFDCKKHVSPETMGIHEASMPVEVYKLYTVKLQQHPVSVVNLDTYRMRLTLHQDLSRFIRGSSTYLIYGENLNDTTWFPNMDTEVIYENRRNMIEALVSGNMLGEAVYGDLTSCAYWITCDIK